MTIKKHPNENPGDNGEEALEELMALADMDASDLDDTEDFDEDAVEDDFEDGDMSLDELSTQTEEDIINASIQEDDVEDEDVEDEDEEVSEDVDEDEEVDEDEDESADEEQSKPAAAEKKERRKPGRREKRIIELNDKKKAAEAKLAEERARREALESQILEIQKAQLDTSIQSADSLIQSKYAELVQAKTNMDYEKEVEIEQELSRLQLGKKEAELKQEQLSQHIQTMQTKAEQKTQTTQAAPADAAMEWASKNFWFRNPQTDAERVKARDALAINNMLIQEGYDASEPEFYQEIDSRLKSMGHTVVAYSQDDTLSLDDLDEDYEDSTSSEVTENTDTKSKTKGQGKKKRKAQQTVQGGVSRTPLNKRKKSGGKRKVTVRLSAAEKAMAHAMGISEQDYAESLHKTRSASSKDSSSYTIL